MRTKKENLINRNSTPFLILAFLHISLFFGLTLRKRPKYAFTLLLSNIGWAYLFEFITLNIFHAYQYKIKLLKKPYFDKIFGAIFSQGLYVPITATLISLFGKGWKWKVASSFLYFCIEHLFLRLKIYKVFWWKPIYTLFFLNLYFYISSGFYKALLYQKKWAMKMAHYLSVVTIQVTFLFYYAVKRKIRFGRGKFHSWYEHFIIAPFYALLLSTIAIFTSPKSGVLPRLMMLFSHITTDKILTETGLVKMKDKPFLSNFPRYALIIYFSRFMYKKIYNQTNES